MQRNFRWRPGVLAATALTLLALLPQAHLWYARGGDWQGAYVSFEGDEAAYAAYLGALIEGRPRLNDPYAGVDARAGAPLPESLFSIQFVPAYALALPARALGLRAPMLFVILAPLATFAASLALFWLLVLLLKDEWLAALGVVVILCLGAAASGQGTLFALVGRRASPIFLPFLRRYVPALPFPLLFLFIALIRRALSATAGERRRQWLSALLAGVVLASLIFSYFYLWTTAAAWLACLALVWLATFGRDGETGAWKVFGVVGALTLLALAPYVLLLSRRAATMDAVQVLQRTRAPDLWRAPELIGYAALALLAYGVWRGLLARRDPATAFAVSFALTPFVVFNQQVLTGLSLQPIHYKVFTLNYIALLAFFYAAALIWQRRDAGAANAARRRIVLRVAAVLLVSAAYGIALLDTVRATRLFAPTNLARDEQMRVVRRMAEIGTAESGTAESGIVESATPESVRADDGRADDGRADDGRGRVRRVALVTSYILSDSLPIAAPQAVLWSPHMLVNSGLTASEHKERIYQYLYYTGVAPADFPRFIDANRFIIYMLFGPARALPYLSNAHTPLTEEEINREGRAYAVYVAAFTREQAARPALSFVITSPERPHDLSQLDRWYERDAGERVGVYTIHRVRLRP